MTMTAGRIVLDFTGASMEAKGTVGRLADGMGPEAAE